MSYLGSKGQAGVFQRIIGNMPPHSIYVEAFFGSGQIFRRKIPAVRNVIIDADEDIIKKFKKARAADNVKMNVADRNAENEVETGYNTAICGDAIAILPTLKLPNDTVIYCDPPYLHSTRTSLHRYKFEMTDKEHAEFLTMANNLKCRVMISGYPSKLYSSHLQNWRCCSYRTRTRGKTVTECLWCNFPEPTKLHDWRFIGKNFRERLTLKRFAKRFTEKINKMPELKKNFVVHLVRQISTR